MTIAYNLKDILTLDEACAELSERFKEEVSIARLFEFEQVGNLTISVRSVSPVPVSNTLFFQSGVRSVTEGMVEQLPASIYATAIEQKERYGSDWRVILGGNGDKFAWVDYIGTTMTDDVELGVYLNKPELPSYLQLVVAKKDLDAFMAKAEGPKVVDGVANEVTKVIGIDGPKKLPASRNSITPLVKGARNGCTLPNDLNAVWNALINMAQLTTPPKPIIGFVPDEGIQYEGRKFFKDEGCDIYSKSALRQYIARNPL